jgi:hypothetical protein
VFHANQFEYFVSNLKLFRLNFETKSSRIRPVFIGHSSRIYRAFIARSREFLSSGKSPASARFYRLTVSGPAGSASRYKPLMGRSRG